jgi:putative transposase
VIVRSFRYRLYPTAEQEALMDATADARRWLYNLALEQRRDWHRQAKANGINLNFVTQSHELTKLRHELPWLAAICYAPLSYALRDLDRAFVAYFKGAARFPAFQSKHRSATFRHKGEDIGLRDDAIRVPKVGWVKLRKSREWSGRIVAGTFRRDALGWHVSIACEIEHDAQLSTLPSVGIDRGISNTLALSTGELLSTPDVSRLERRKRKAQRILSRRKRGSNRYFKQRRRLSRIMAKMARVRDHWQHEVTTDLVRRFGHVVLEDLHVAKMVKTSRDLARGIHEQAWTGFADKLAYKLEERGGTLTKVNPAYTSQECSACGVIDKRSRESQARFACRHCGFEEHADINAANNILRRSTAVVEGLVPDETRTDCLAA